MGRYLGISLALPLLAAILSGCSSGQHFSEVAGNIRVTGQIAQNIFSPQNISLSVKLADASTGRPVDASAVEVRGAGTPEVRAVRQKPGSYKAQVDNTDRMDVTIVTPDRTEVIALQRQ